MSIETHGAEAMKNMNSRQLRRDDTGQVRVKSKGPREIAAGYT